MDANLVLADNTADWSYANLVTSNYGTPTSTTRNSGGFAVIDLLAFSKCPAKGLACVLVLTEAGAAAGDALTVLLQSSTVEAFSDDIHTLANFEVDADAGTGIIDGDETPCTIIRRFATEQRYIRIDASCTSGDDFGTVYCYIDAHPFYVL